MKIATWNVNSIRVRLEAVLNWMDQAQPDVLCLQEIKVTDELFPAASFVRLWATDVAVSGQKTYNGVAIVSKHDMTEVLTGFPDYEAEGQKAIGCCNNRWSESGKRLCSQWLSSGFAQVCI